MTEESSISIEETNSIRSQLGLKPIPVRNQTHSTIDQQDNLNETSLSIDETNELRVSLGMKPIGQSPSRESRTTEDYQKEQTSQQRNKQVKEKIEELKQKAIRRSKVNDVKTLADDDADVGFVNTDDWLSRIKKPSVVSGPDSIKSTSNRRMQKSFSDKSSSQAVRVAHNLKDFDTLSGDVVLTLKDRSILDEEEDEVESGELLKRKKLQKDLSDRNKTGRYDSEGNERGLIDKYNEELGNVDNDNYFVINANPVKLEESDTNDQDIGINRKRKIQFSLDIEDEEEKQERSDYADAKPIKMKKLKKISSKSSSRRKKHQEDDNAVSEDVEMTNVELTNEDINIQDDSELQSMLSLRRMNELTRKKRLTPQDLAKEIKENQDNEMDVDEDSSNAFVIDENTEFLSSIRKSEEPEEAIESNVVHEKTEESGPIRESYYDEMMNESEKEDRNRDEVSFAGGLASTLSFLKSKNVVKEKSNSEIHEQRETLELKSQADWKKLQLEISKRIHKQSLESDPNLAKLSTKQREVFVEKELEQFKSLQTPEDIAKKLENYKPNINLKYIDELGREMNTKEAYKHLSHQFHGKAPNKSKVEKKMKKFKQEKKAQQNEKLLE